MPMTATSPTRRGEVRAPPPTTVAARPVAARPVAPRPVAARPTSSKAAAAAVVASMPQILTDDLQLSDSDSSSDDSDL